MKKFSTIIAKVKVDKPLWEITFYVNLAAKNTAGNRSAVQSLIWNIYSL